MGARPNTTTRLSSWYNKAFCCSRRYNRVDDVQGERVKEKLQNEFKTRQDLLGKIPVVESWLIPIPNVCDFGPQSFLSLCLQIILLARLSIRPPPTTPQNPCTVYRFCPFNLPLTLLCV